MQINTGTDGQKLDMIDNGPAPPTDHIFILRLRENFNALNDRGKSE